MRARRAGETELRASRKDAAPLGYCLKASMPLNRALEEQMRRTWPPESGEQLCSGTSVPP
jgi:hypothetical protein